MNWTTVLSGVVTAVALAIIFGIAKLFQRMGTLETKVEPVVAWYFKTSMDALRLATNPTSERLHALANKYIDSVIGRGQITNQEKEELIAGLLEVWYDKGERADKRQSASVSLRFIETREHRSLLPPV